MGTDKSNHAWNYTLPRVARQVSQLPTHELFSFGNDRCERPTALARVGVRHISTRARRRRCARTRKAAIFLSSAASTRSRIGSFVSSRLICGTFPFSMVRSVHTGRASPVGGSPVDRGIAAEGRPVAADPQCRAGPRQARLEGQAAPQQQQLVAAARGGHPHCEGGHMARTNPRARHAPLLSAIAKLAEGRFLPTRSAQWRPRSGSGGQPTCAG